ncbi:hypothetical protein O0I10_007143 [Lichtheimia ornata]|uniref:Autophagy-related protein 29 n=1 Tax=Lichtheimia ornata TaxID=688661 RepID=A0AAD7XU29_9FUNG|nr:uncharacterized protein O0I10_007143 [Lichtheimia ornata]KAJ8657064.1 hypothetical protein O0I10_007143 [Lichtheimia ornata]
MSLEKDTLHVVIRLPFKRPQGFIEPPQIRWTDEMEQRLRQYMSQKYTDWNYIAEQLEVPVSYLVRHAAFIYETQLRGIHQQLRMNDKSTTPPPAQRQSSRRSTPRSSETVDDQSTPTPTPNTTKPVKDDAMMLSTISNVEPRVPPVASVVEESLYKSSLQSSRSYYSAEQSLEDDQEEDEEEDEDGDEAFAKQFEQLQMEEPAFLPVKRNESSSFALGHARRRQQQQQQQQAGRSDEEASRSTISLESSNASVTQSALEDALLSRLNHGSKMSSMAMSKR